MFLRFFLILSCKTRILNLVLFKNFGSPQISSCEFSSLCRLPQRSAVRIYQNMEQKSILSFFKKSPRIEENGSEKIAAKRVSSSPIKKNEELEGTKASRKAKSKGKQESKSKEEKNSGDEETNNVKTSKRKPESKRKSESKNKKEKNSGDEEANNVETNSEKAKKDSGDVGTKQKRKSRQKASPAVKSSPKEEESTKVKLQAFARDAKSEEMDTSVNMTSQDENGGKENEDHTNSHTPIKATKKRIRVISSSEDEDSENKKSPACNEETSSVNKKLKTESQINDDGDDNEENVENKSDDENSKETQNMKKSLQKYLQTSRKVREAKDDKSPERSPKKNGEEKESSLSTEQSPKKKEVKKKLSPSAGLKKKTSGKEDEKSVKSEGKGKYNPGKSRYHPVDDALWSRGDKVPYGALAKTLEEIENTSSRLQMINILANYLRSVMILSPDDLVPSIYLCLNKVAPDYEGLELGIGETLLMKALGHATGRTVDKIKAEVAEKGDLGLVAESSRSNQRVMFPPPKLTVSSVFAKLKEIAQMTGTSSMSKKIEKIQVMFVSCRDSEARYLIRSLSGKLRIGLAEQSVLMALAQAATMTPPNQEWPPEIVDASIGTSAESFKKKVQKEALILKTTYCECPNYEMLVPVLLKEGISALPKSNCHLTPGIPLKPMLAHPTKEISQILKRFENAKFTCEYKYDGERAQIHLLPDGTVHVYSRNQENNTTKYPDIIALIPKVLKETTRSFVIDSEAVAWDSAKNTILPFQILSTRKKKNADASEIKVHVCVFAFDLLYLNGESMVRKPLQERRQALREAFNTIDNEFVFAKSIDTDKIEDIEEFLEESIKGNCEGLMVKTLDIDATYEIAKRSHNWLKVKKDYLEGVGDTLDLVVIGGYHGKGKRTGAFGGFLLACYDEQNEEYQTICKIGTGFKEEELERHTTFLKDHIIPAHKSYYQFDSSMQPDVWFEPVQVWEVKCADLSVSPVHKAGVGIVDPEKGISLRFPRFLRIRDDKNPEDATNASQVADMYSNQEQVKNQTNDLSKSDDELL